MLRAVMWEKESLKLMLMIKVEADDKEAGAGDHKDRGGVVYPLGSCGGIGNIIKRRYHFLVV
uniref:Uncharacterized protein n=1 Tax=viral metagenome TaxID=1070528 RepID=A0A6M3M2U4_9ZZZZ